jgi:hypothetical protein
MNPKRHPESLANLGNYSASFSANEFVLPQSVRRCPGFDNDCPETKNCRSVFKSRCPELKTFRPALGNACPGFEARCPGFQNSRPGSVNRCHGFFRLCPGFQTLAPFLKAFAPISGMLRLFCNLLPHSYLSHFHYQPSTPNYQPT